MNKNERNYFGRKGVARQLVGIPWKPGYIQFAYRRQNTPFLFVFWDFLEYTWIFSYALYTDANICELYTEKKMAIISDLINNTLLLLFSRTESISAIDMMLESSESPKILCKTMRVRGCSIRHSSLWSIKWKNVNWFSNRWIRIPGKKDWLYVR